MIADTVENLRKYVPLSKGFGIVADFCEKNDLKALEAKRYDLESGVFANVSDYCPKAGDKAEAHRDYCDLQLVVSGSENMKISPLIYCSESTGYSPDAEFFASFGHAAEIEVNEGMFAFFAPQDAHLPCINNGCESVRKIVFKIPVNI